MTDVPREFVLASGSGIRRRLLEDAGFDFEVVRPNIDERALETGAEKPQELAIKLATAKALAVTAQRPGSLVLGSDQVFTLEGKPWAKPETTADLRDKLTMMSGATHVFFCGFSLVQDGQVRHESWDSVAVEFYELSEDEIEDYVDSEEGIGCAGGYRLEEGGVRLIKNIAGSHFTVLGLPMIPLVAWLRAQGLLDALTKKRKRS